MLRKSINLIFLNIIYMKKLLLIITFLCFSLNLNADISYYKKINNIQMEIFRNNELIGYSNYFFVQKNNQIEISNEINFKVNLFGVDVFKVYGDGLEKYIDGKLVSFESKTQQNDRKKYVKLFYDENANKFIIEGSSYKGEASINNVVGNWWNHEILEVDSQISPISGSIKKQVVNFIGKEEIELYGKKYITDHYKLKSKNQELPNNKKLDFDIWYDKNTSMILKVSYSRMGKWEYRLKSFQ